MKYITIRLFLIASLLLVGETLHAQCNRMRTASLDTSSFRLKPTVQVGSVSANSCSTGKCLAKLDYTILSGRLNDLDEIVGYLRDVPEKSEFPQMTEALNQLSDLVRRVRAQQQQH
jgi:hypothetical protein